MHEQTPDANGWVEALADDDLLDRHCARTSTRAGLLQRACAKAIREHALRGELPTSATFLFYELEQAGVVSKRPVNSRTGLARKRTERQDIADALLRLREHGLVPWDAVGDATRSVAVWAFADTVADYMRKRVNEARIDAWDGNPAPLVLCEARSLAAVLERLASRYLAPIAGTSGQVQGFLHTDIAPLFDGEEREVLYLGDHDHQGGQIEANTRRVLVRALGRELPWTRVAITAEQAEGIEPVLKEDRRYRPSAFHEAWEAEALGQRRVSDLLRAALDARLPEPLPQVLARQEAEREQTEKRLADEE